GAVRGLARPAQAASFVACALVAVSYLSGGQAPGGAAIAPIALAALGYCLIPLPPLKRAWALLDPSRRRRVDPERLGQRLGDGARRRVHGVAAVFRALAGGYAAPARPDDEQAFIQAMRSRLCEGCAGYEGCWCGDERRALRLMEKLLGDALSGRLALSAADLPPDVCRQCRRAPQIEKRLSSMLAEFAARRAAEQGRAECRALCARQFSQAAELMHRLSAQLAHPVALDERCATLAAAALDREGLPAAEVMALVGERTEIAAVLSKGTWSAAAARRAARRLSEELGLPLQPLLSLGDGPEGELRFVEVPRLCVTAAVASRPHTAGQPSGDTATSRPLPGGRHMLALSDGMGSGAAAAAESAGAVALLGTFLAADVDKPLALESINGLMMLGGGDDMFATVDLCVIDLMSGEASFHKLGACASAVLRGREVIRVAGGRLPLGILEQVKPTQTTITLRPGDRVVMVSDGVADPTRPGQQEWLDALLEGMAATQPRQLSERILQAAAGRDGGPTDDMTVLVAQIERADEKFW
ncbi:MAG: SpoIIE family protein phosphatase, partial [Clostridiales bacterium]|nr:SpoIIE family protein phosphatase [Clostridiales bacterium]